MAFSHSCKKNKNKKKLWSVYNIVLGFKRHMPLSVFKDKVQICKLLGNSAPQLPIMMFVSRWGSQLSWKCRCSVLFFFFFFCTSLLLTLKLRSWVRLCFQQQHQPINHLGADLRHYYFVQFWHYCAHSHQVSDTCVQEYTVHKCRMCAPCHKCYAVGPLLKIAQITRAADV